MTSPANRSKALAHVGIAFAICFCIGPPIGAYFASRPVPSNSWGPELNIYAAPAILSLVLLVAETAFLMVALPETLGKGAPVQDGEKTTRLSNGKDDSKPLNKYPFEMRIKILKDLRTLHFLFLVLFSGIEFTLTFLTFDCECFLLSISCCRSFDLHCAVLDWNNVQNGKLIGAIGVVSALLQGGYVRRSISRVGEGIMARRGVSSCAIALVFLAILPHYVGTNPSISMKLLQAAAICMAFTSATVVNSLTAFASLQCDDDLTTDTGKKGHPKIAKGKALGEFRSSGQLGRAIGPLLGEVSDFGCLLQKLIFSHQLVPHTGHLAHH